MHILPCWLPAVLFLLFCACNGVENPGSKVAYIGVHPGVPEGKKMTQNVPEATFFLH